MSPEQADAHRGQIGPPSDVYSLGTILYQMLTGRPPFQAASPVDTLLMVLEQDPVPPRLLNAKADRDLEMIALKCLQKPAQLRYASAEGLASDLNAYLSGEPVSARSGGFTQVIARVFVRLTMRAVGELGAALDVAQRGAVRTLPGDELASVAKGPFTLALFMDLGGRAGDLGRYSGPCGGGLVRSRSSSGRSRICGAMAVIASIELFVIEWILGLPVLTLSPVLGLIGGMVFAVKAGILSGAVLRSGGRVVSDGRNHGPLAAVWPHDFTGVVTGLCFFLPGWKYYRQRFACHRLRNQLDLFGNVA